MDNMRELLAEALDELKAHIIIVRPKSEGARWQDWEPWCLYCKRYGHLDDCIISRIERALEATP